MGGGKQDGDGCGVLMNEGKANVWMMREDVFVRKRE